MVRIDPATWPLLTKAQQARLDAWLAHHGQPTTDDNVVQQVIFGAHQAMVTIIKLDPQGHPYPDAGGELAVRYQALPLPVSGLGQELESCLV